MIVCNLGFGPLAITRFTKKTPKQSKQTKKKQWMGKAGKLLANTGKLLASFSTSKVQLYNIKLHAMH